MRNRLAVLACSLAILTAACSGGSPSGSVAAPSGAITAAPSSSEAAPSGTIKIWGHQGQEGEVAAVEQAVKDFNASQTAITAELQLIPDADYTKTVTATPASGLPDVLEFDGPFMSSFAYAKKLQPVEGLVSQATIDNQTDSVKAQNTYADGKLYGVSMFDSGLGIYGNKKMLDAAGVAYPTGLSDVWTAEEFGAALQAIAGQSPGGMALDIKEQYAGEWPTYGFLPIVSSAGSAVLKDGKASGNLDSDAVVKAVTEFASWHQYIDPNTDDKSFTGGRVALSWVGHWVYNAYAEALGEDLVVLPLPDFGNGTKTGQGSFAWGIGAESQNPAGAGAFLDFLVNDANVKAITDSNGAPPGTTSVVATSPLYQAGGPLELFAQQLAATCGNNPPTASCVAVPRPVTAGYPVISQQFSQAFFNIYRGADGKTELGKAAVTIDTDFADNNNYAP